MKGRIGDRPFIVLQPMRFDLLGQQMALGDLHLLILGVTGDADDLHAVPSAAAACAVWLAVV